MATFSIIILNWNGCSHLQTFLPSVVKSDHPDFEIILADNASTDESVKWVRTHYPEVRVLSFDENYGYCKGNNLAAKSANGDFLIFLNNDVKVDKSWLQPLKNVFDRFPKTAAVQPKLLSYRQPNYFEYAGAAGGMLDRLGFPYCRGRTFLGVERDEGQYDDYPEKIFWASGAALCIRKTLFEEIGGFDERFEFHMEEIDLCWRLQRLGYEIRVAPDAVVWHLGGGSLHRDDPRKLYYNFRNNLIMLTKNYDTTPLPLLLFVRSMTDGAIALSFLLRGLPSHWKNIAKAYRDFFSKLPYWLEERGRGNSKL